MAPTLIATVLLATAALQAGVRSEPRKRPPPPKVMLGDQSTGSRAPAVHAIPLRDPEGDTIQPDDRLPLPLSPAKTCGADCHNVQSIGRGWHFNATLPGIPAGRNGQPWFLVDPETATQIPLSYRKWPGTYQPQQLGMSTWEFALRFGGRTAGGLSGEDGGSRSKPARWTVSGNLEVNCLVCHDASPAYDQAEYARQIALENFRYAPGAASGIAAVTGSAKDMPDFFDYLLPFSIEDGLQPKVPAVQYARSRFLPGEKIAFDVPREVKSGRCYYCHTNVDVEETGNGRWKAAEDVHLSRGITCVECHANGLDHLMVRGYEGESGVAQDSFTASLSCRNCHMDSAKGANSARRRMGAPSPKHAGIPPVHFDKLSCTACHSGPWPGSETRRLKNGLSHGLGEHNSNKAADALPHIYYPVFARMGDGKLSSYRAVWPAFWGRLRNGSVEPLHPAEVKRMLAKAKLALQPPADGGWPKIEEPWVRQALRQIESQTGVAYMVYVAGGKLRRLNPAGGLITEDDPQAEPYLWPLAHDVRPASQALGARGCEDCHSANAAFLFGNVTVDSPLGSEPGWKMNRFEKNLDIKYQVRLAETWLYRPWLKGIGLTAAAILLLVISGYLVKAVDSLTVRLAGKR